ncbi:conserved protein of unknown function [Methylorubrum extorquens]|uniref:Uncharacterized protein n=1 Tax=Methylorubrum extorquens TaxID=408 RepID=A0A2N9ANB6_METEX|nr:hypothetical protein ASF36_19105 [Methylobacterium sp. Leaf90]SOR28825.1 conserved protein of unknown function [Methylorubrum extorquens]
MTLSPPKPPRREPKVDLSGLTDRQILVRQGVVTLGELAFGPRWQSDLAAALSQEAGRRVGQAQVSHWVLGVRPVPESLVEPLQQLAMRIAADLVRRADRIRADWSAAPQEDVDALPGPPA